MPFPDPEGDQMLSPAELIAQVGESSVLVEDLEAQVDAELAQSETVSADNDVPLPEQDVTKLSEEERELFASLLTCGHRRRTIDVMGHSVTVRSLSAADDLRIGLYAKDYVGSSAEQRAYQVGVAASGIVAINGKPLHQSLTVEVDLQEEFEAKRDKVEAMTPLVVAQVYRAILSLESEFIELAQRLGKLRG